ncbi:MAG: hypothetical protein WA126_04190 [Thermodesulfovibrionales bacterium]
MPNTLHTNLHAGIHPTACKNLLLLYQAQDEVDVRKENLINEIEARIKQKTETNELFTIKWKLI